MSVLRKNKFILGLLLLLFMMILPACEFELPVVEITPSPTATPTATPTPRATNAPTPTPDVLGTRTDATSVSFELNGGQTYRLNYSTYGSNLVVKQEVIGPTVCASGLKPSTTYNFDIEVMNAKGQFEPWMSDLSATTKADGAGDPFKNIYTIINVNSQSKFVACSSLDGCLGAKVWPNFDCAIYADPDLSKYKAYISGGTQFNISMDDGIYCYMRKNGRWSIHIRGISSTTGEIEGWADADIFFIDLRDLFRPEEDMYGIKINRTNAYRSVFTIGGSCLIVDGTSGVSTRFTCLDSSAKKFTETGYNVIAGITNESLPNYGGMNQMPVIWDLALELIVCQKNALANGTTLIIYEGYRPNSTSHKVSDAVKASGLLSRLYNGRTLANGFLSSSYSESNFIAYDSNHNKGTAVDLSLVSFIAVDKIGYELKMQTKMHTLDFRGSMSYNNDNANLLYKIMTNGTNLEALRSGAEWWHFQLKTDTRLFPQIRNYKYVDYVM